MILTKEDVRSCRGEDEDTGDLANLPLAIDGVVVSALFREMTGGETKVSLRSKGEIDVAALASGYGGGGHRNASGILMRAPAESVIRQVLGRVVELLPPGSRSAVGPLAGSR